MTKLLYANETNILILVAALKAHGIKRVIASPGTTNLAFVASLQCDSFFEMYSCVDERSAAYMAVGMVEESGEPVVITCTGATASRNYLSALTEAYYRKLPILVVTGTKDVNRAGQLHEQFIDRSVAQKDVLVASYLLPSVHYRGDSITCELRANQAINDLTKNGGGPVHINLTTEYTRDYSVTELPKFKVIKRIGYDNIDQAPNMPIGKIGVFVGSHSTFSDDLTRAIDRFCASRDAVVFCDHTSGYYGKYKLNHSLVAVQSNYLSDLCNLDLCIHIGEISGEYGCLSEKLKKRNVWRVNTDGVIRDLFGKMTYMFELTETDFFNYYTLEDSGNEHVDFLTACKKEYDDILSKAVDIPFSNVWIASQLAHRIPAGSSIHLGILNSLRTWNFFTFPTTVKSFCNVGGFGIDGCLSSMLGASYVHPDKLYFGVVGDLSFFYDMNSIGNRHVGNNVRLLVVNNGKGTEFRNFYHIGSMFGEDADKYIAAGGHFGNKSKSLLKHYAEDLGYHYFSASNKDQFLQYADSFVSPIVTESMVFEVFTNNEDESDAINYMWNLVSNKKGVAANQSSKVEKKIQKIIGKKGIAILKIILGRK